MFERGREHTAQRRRNMPVPGGTVSHEPATPESSWASCHLLVSGPFVAPSRKLSHRIAPPLLRFVLRSGNFLKLTLLAMADSDS